MLMPTGLSKMARWSVSMVHLPITLLGNPHILWQQRTFRSPPFFLVAFHGNFTSGTAQSGSLTDVVQTTQVTIPTSGRQKITYVLSNQDKLFVFDHSDPVNHSEVVFFTLSYDAGVAQRIREDFWGDIKLTRWGAALIPSPE